MINTFIRLFAILSFTLIFGLGNALAQQDDTYFLIKKNFNIFSKTFEHISLDYVDEVNPERLMRFGIDAMLETLDPYTVLISESQNEQAEIMSRGNYAGIGLEVGYREGSVVVIAPIEGSPAEKAGIRAGDIIIAVDSVSTENLQPEEVNTLTTGEVGSEVDITVSRFGLNQPLDFTLVRERIDISNISYSGLIGENNATGYIRLSQFGVNSGDEVRTALINLTEKTELNGLILDLRDNPGGILQEAVKIIDKFIEPGITAVDIRGRVSEYNQTFVTNEPVMFEKPVILLMNEGSASASEVVAGALQDLDRALIIGDQSFGKGLVQIVKPLPYNTSLKITISRYFIPSGRSIQSVQYTHQGRNAVLKNAESSKKEFKTRNGRTVYEGRGIEPDIKSEKSNPSMLQIALLQKSMYFNFATEYESEHEIFEYELLPDEVYQQFLNYLNEHDFRFKVNSEIILSDLEGELKNSNGLTDHINALKESIEKEKQQLFVEDESSIKRALFLELTSRYKGNTGKIEAGLHSDPDVDIALDLIADPNKINNMLSGQ